MIRVAQGKKPIPQANGAPPLGVVTEFDAPLTGMGNKNAIIAQYNEDAYQNWDQNVLDPCPNCNRTFVPTALKIHLKSCKPGKPLKPPIQRNRQFI
jgi:hypothetical protein